MSLLVTRTNIRINPDHKKVIPRFFNTGNERSLLIISNVIGMKEADAKKLLDATLDDFSSHYKNIQQIFLKHFNLIKYLIPEEDKAGLTENKKLLLGAYFTMEYSIEAAALFNPSIVEDPYQLGAGVNEKKVIVSFRATGESHISSLIFKQGLLDENGMVYFEKPGKFISEGVVTEQIRDNKLAFKNVLSQMSLPKKIVTHIINQLQDHFSYKEMELVLKNTLQNIEPDTERKRIKYTILSKVNTSYELQFPVDSLLSERVIFPVTSTEKNGIEDARFVKFTEEDGSFFYIGTYTAYNGTFITPQLIITDDFCHFKIRPLHGKAAVNKNLALFPRRINGQYAMISRIDGMNNYLMFSDDLYMWDDATLLQQPKYPWEFIQVGNAGSPIETEKGWLIITHGVGAMRKYCLGASLFDLNEPMIELGRLKEPFLIPNEDERDGYVPNVVYSCGSLIHNGKLVIPYAVSDYASSFATVQLDELLDEILSSE